MYFKNALFAKGQQALHFTFVNSLPVDMLLV